MKMEEESSRSRLEISSKTAASSNLYTRVARLIKRSQSKPKLIAAAARTACPGMGRAMREIRRNLGIGIGIAAVQVGHCTPPCTGLTAECGPSVVGSAVPFKPQSTPCIDSAAAVAASTSLPPLESGPSAGISLFVLHSRSLGCISPHRTRASSSVSLLYWIKARRCTVRAFGGPFVSPLMCAISIYFSVIENARINNTIFM